MSLGLFRRGTAEESCPHITALGGVLNTGRLVTHMELDNERKRKTSRRSPVWSVGAGTSGRDVEFNNVGHLQGQRLSMSPISLNFSETSTSIGSRYLAGTYTCLS